MVPVADRDAAQQISCQATLTVPVGFCLKAFFRQGADQRAGIVARSIQNVIHQLKSKIQPEKRAEERYKSMVFEHAPRVVMPWVPPRSNVRQSQCPRGNESVRRRGFQIHDPEHCRSTTGMPRKMAGNQRVDRFTCFGDRERGQSHVIPSE